MSIHVIGKYNGIQWLNIYIYKNTVMHNFLYPRKQTIGSTMVNLALARSSDAAHQVRPPEGWNDHDLRREATWEKGGKNMAKWGF